MSRLFWTFVASYRMKFAFILGHDIFISYSFIFTVMKTFDALWSDILMTLLNEIPKTLPVLRNYMLRNPRVVTFLKSGECFLPGMKAH